MRIVAEMAIGIDCQLSDLRFKACNHVCRQALLIQLLQTLIDLVHAAGATTRQNQSGHPLQRRARTHEDYPPIYDISTFFSGPDCWLRISE